MLCPEFLRDLLEHSFIGHIWAFPKLWEVDEKFILPSWYFLNSENIEAFFLEFPFSPRGLKLASTAWKVSAFGAILARMRENPDQNNSEYGQFLRSEVLLKEPRSTLGVLWDFNAQKHFLKIFKNTLFTEYLRTAASFNLVETACLWLAVFWKLL